MLSVADSSPDGGVPGNEFMKVSVNSYQVAIAGIRNSVFLAFDVTWRRRFVVAETPVGLELKGHQG